MMEGWEEVKLKKVTKIINGFAFKSKDFDEYSEIPIVKIKSLKNQVIIVDETAKVSSSFLQLDKKYHINKDDILIALTGSHITQPASAVGRVAKSRLEETLLLNQRVAKFDINYSLCDHNFLFYFLTTDYFFENIGLRARGGSNQANISGGDILSTKINLPPLKTQRKIASILSGYDDLIENNLKHIKLLEEQAQQTYEEWFVRFKFPGYEDVEIDAVSGLPVGWEKKTIKEACDISGGGTPSRKNDEYWDNGQLTWFSPTDLSKSNSLCVLNSSQKITDLGLKKSSAKLLESNSFMMTSRATIGLFAIIEKSFSTNQGFINVTPFEKIDKEYLLYNFITRIEEFKGYATGSTFPELSKGKFKVLKIVWPSENLLNNFHVLTSIIHKQIFNLTNQNQLLKEARDILLPRLMSGMIDVDGLEVDKQSGVVAEENTNYNKA